MEAAIANGATYVKGCVEGIETVEGLDGMKEVRAVLVDGAPLPCDGAVFTMGPWTALAEDWLGLPIPITGIKSTSIVFKSDADIAPFALFCSEDDRFSTHLEVYPRTSGEVYLCGVGGSEHVSPERLRQGEYPPGGVHPDPARVKAAAESFQTLSKTLGKPHPDQAQACMRPCPPDAIPIMGKVAHIKGAYVSAGHNCWGILWAPVSGKAMAELVTTGAATCVDLEPFDPARFMTKTSGGRGRKRGGVSIGEQW
jgi:glycine/D-amino acid oxidase-like deaminating enzyme